MSNSNDLRLTPLNIAGAQVGPALQPPPFQPNPPHPAFGAIRPPPVTTTERPKVFKCLWKICGIRPLSAGEEPSSSDLRGAAQDLLNNTMTYLPEAAGAVLATGTATPAIAAGNTTALAEGGGGMTALGWAPYLAVPVAIASLAYWAHSALSNQQTSPQDPTPESHSLTAQEGPSPV